MRSAAAGYNYIKLAAPWSQIEAFSAPPTLPGCRVPARSGAGPFTPRWSAFILCSWEFIACAAGQLVVHHGFLHLMRFSPHRTVPAAVHCTRLCFTFSFPSFWQSLLLSRTGMKLPGLCRQPLKKEICVRGHRYLRGAGKLASLARKGRKGVCDGGRAGEGSLAGAGLFPQGHTHDEPSEGRVWTLTQPIQG